jgi:hypothetical protein
MIESDATIAIHNPMKSTFRLRLKPRLSLIFMKDAYSLVRIIKTTNLRIARFSLV